GRPASACCCALRILEAATICIALVICAVLRIDLIRRRMSCVFAITNYRLQTVGRGAAVSSPSRLEFIESRFQLRLEIFVEVLFLADRPEQSSFPCLQPILKLQLVLLDTFDGH